MSDGSGDGGVGGFGGFGADNIRAEVERHGPPTGGEQWRDGEGPRRRARPMVVLIAIAVFLVIAFIALALLASGDSDDAAASQPVERQAPATAHPVLLADSGA